MRRMSEKEIRRRLIPTLFTAAVFFLLGIGLFLQPTTTSSALYRDLIASEETVAALHWRLTVRGISPCLTTEGGAIYILTGKYDAAAISDIFVAGDSVTVRFYQDTIGRWLGWRYASQIEADGVAVVAYAYSPVIGSLWRNVLATVALAVALLMAWSGWITAESQRRQEALRDRRIRRKYGRVGKTRG